MSEKVRFATLKEARTWVEGHDAITFITMRPYLVACACVVCNDELYVETGTARCSTEDEWDTGRGQRIAWGRAEKKLAGALYRAYRDWGMIYHPLNPFTHATAGLITWEGKAGS